MERERSQLALVRVHDCLERRVAHECVQRGNGVEWSRGIGEKSRFRHVDHESGRAHFEKLGLFEHARVCKPELQALLAREQARDGIEMKIGGRERRPHEVAGIENRPLRRTHGTPQNPVDRGTFLGEREPTMGLDTPGAREGSARNEKGHGGPPNLTECEQLRNEPQASEERPRRRVTHTTERALDVFLFEIHETLEPSTPAKRGQRDNDATSDRQREC